VTEKERNGLHSKSSLISCGTSLAPLFISIHRCPALLMGTVFNGPQSYTRKLFRNGDEISTGRIGDERLRKSY
jgi:hypothetical protein